MIRATFTLTLCLLLPCALNAGTGKALHILVENPSLVSRQNETIEVPLKEIASVFGNIGYSRIGITEETRGTTLVSQVTDQCMLFQTSLAAKEKKEFVLREVNVPSKSPGSRVDGRYVLPREDYAWENDRIAFRMYGPALVAEVNNGIDVWTKRVHSLIVAKWYKESESSPPGKDTYHKDQGEGADFFEVGRSLGAGGSGLWVDGVVRQPGVFSAQRTLMNGPIRVSFELTYAWTLDDSRFTEKRIISLDAGQNLNKIQVTFAGSLPRDTVSIACGLVKRPNTEIHVGGSRNWLSLWGLTNADSANGYLGTAVILDKRDCAGIAQDTVQHIILAKATSGRAFTYFAGAGWTEAGNFHSESDWITYLTARAASLFEPLHIRYERID